MSFASNRKYLLTEDTKHRILCYMFQYYTFDVNNIAMLSNPRSDGFEVLKRKLIDKQPSLTQIEDSLDRILESYVSNQNSRIFCSLTSLYMWRNSSMPFEILELTMKHIHSFFSRSPYESRRYTSQLTYAQRVIMIYHVCDPVAWGRLIDAYSALYHSIYKRAWEKRQSFEINVTAPLQISIGPLNTILECFPRERVLGYPFANAGRSAVGTNTGSSAEGANAGSSADGANTSSSASGAATPALSATAANSDTDQQGHGYDPARLVRYRPPIATPRGDIRTAVYASSTTTTPAGSMRYVSYATTGIHLEQKSQSAPSGPAMNNGQSVSNTAATWVSTTTSVTAACQSGTPYAGMVQMPVTPQQLIQSISVPAYHNPVNGQFSVQQGRAPLLLQPMNPPSFGVPLPYPSMRQPPARGPQGPF